MTPDQDEEAFKAASKANKNVVWSNRDTWFAALAWERTRLLLEADAKYAKLGFVRVPATVKADEP